MEWPFYFLASCCLTGAAFGLIEHPPLASLMVLGVMLIFESGMLGMAKRSLKAAAVNLASSFMGISTFWGAFWFLGDFK